MRRHWKIHFAFTITTIIAITTIAVFFSWLHKMSHRQTITTYVTVTVEYNGLKKKENNLVFPPSPSSAKKFNCVDSRLKTQTNGKVVIIMHQQQHILSAETDETRMKQNPHRMKMKVNKIFWAFPLPFFYAKLLIHFQWLPSSEYNLLKCSLFSTFLLMYNMW